MKRIFEHIVTKCQIVTYRGGGGSGTNRFYSDCGHDGLQSHGNVSLRAFTGSQLERSSGTNPTNPFSWSNQTVRLALLLSSTWSQLGLPYDRRSVGQSVLISGHHLGSAIIFSFSSIVIIFRYLHFCSSGTSAPTRGRIYNFLVQLLLGLTNADTLGYKSYRIHEFVTVPHSFIWDWVPFLSPLSTRGATV
jgi:hypothetical protein